MDRDHILCRLLGVQVGSMLKSAYFGVSRPGRLWKRMGSASLAGSLQIVRGVLDVNRKGIWISLKKSRTG